MNDKDRLDAVEFTKLWYDEMYPRKVSKVTTLTDLTDDTVLTEETQNRFRNCENILLEGKLIDACKEILSKYPDSRVAIINPTIFDKQYLSEQEYELGLTSYYSSVICEFDMESILYRYDSQIPMHVDDKDYVFDILSYCKYNNSSPDIADVVNRIYNAYLVPAKHNAEILIIDGWNVTSSGPHIKSIAKTFKILAERYPTLYDKVFYALGESNASIFTKVMSENTNVNKESYNSNMCNCLLRFTV